MASETGSEQVPKPTDDGAQPVESTQEVLTNDELPSVETQNKIAAYKVLDRHGKEHPFRDLYSGPDSTDRVLIIFVRHFFCGSCQDYLQSLSEAITPSFLSELPVSTSIVIIGCGDPGLIDTYTAASGCQFPMYADPTRKLYDDLEMVSSLALGPRPEYIRRGFVRNVAESIWQGVKQIPSGLAHKGGDTRQIGGEFLFEAGGDGGEKRVTWCHRMKTTRDHTEASELSRILNG